MQAGYSSVNMRRISSHVAISISCSEADSVFDHLKHMHSLCKTQSAAKSLSGFCRSALVNARRLPVRGTCLNTDY